jgi:dTDP-4-dehydrorhamnose 3,5-epimerase
MIAGFFWRVIIGKKWRSWASVRASCRTISPIFDVVVDLRRTSSTFGRWFGVLLSEDNCRMLWIPSGFAHGFSVISDGAHVLYKTTDWYHPESERTIRWNDSDLNIDWRLSGQPIISAKDGLGVPFAEANKFE